MIPTLKTLSWMLKTWKINWMRQTLQQSSVGYTQNLVAVRAMKVAKKARIKTLVCDAFSSTSFSSKLPLYCLWLTRNFFSLPSFEQSQAAKADLSSPLQAAIQKDFITILFFKDRSRKAVNRRWEIALGQIDLEQTKEEWLFRHKCADWALWTAWKLQVTQHKWWFSRWSSGKLAFKQGKQLVL